MQFDDVNIGGQLIVGTGVCAAIKEGRQAINGSMLAEGPVVLVLLQHLVHKKQH